MCMLVNWSLKETYRRDSQSGQRSGSVRQAGGGWRTSRQVLKVKLTVPARGWSVEGWGRKVTWMVCPDFWLWQLGGGAGAVYQDDKVGSQQFGGSRGFCFDLTVVLLSNRSVTLNSTFFIWGFPTCIFSNFTELSSWRSAGEHTANEGNPRLPTLRCLWREGPAGSLGVAGGEGEAAHVAPSSTESLGSFCVCLSSFVLVWRTFRERLHKFTVHRMADVPAYHWDLASVHCFFSLKGLYSVLQLQ